MTIMHYQIFGRRVFFNAVFGIALAVAAAIVLIAGCGGGNQGGQAAAAAHDVLLSEPPAQSMEVHEARRNSNSEPQTVTVVGRIGGQARPFVDGRTAFMIVDRKLHHCPPEERCPTPWDYCCDPATTRANSALVIVVDASGQPIQQDARQAFGLEPLTTVFAEGTAQSDEQGNLTIRAKRIYIERSL